MAIWIKWTEEQEKMYEQWVAERPPSIRENIAKHNLRADRLYLLKTTGHRVVLNSFVEKGTVSVNILGKFNPKTIIPGKTERTVYNINPADLEECDWDGPVEDGQIYLDKAD